MNDLANSGDTFNMSGDFRGAMVNIKSTLTHVSQRISGLAHGEPADRAELQELIAQLQAALQQAPPEQAEAAEAVAKTAEALVEAAQADQPNRTMIQLSGEGLKQAAKNLAEVMPAVLVIATRIVETISRWVG